MFFVDVMPSFKFYIKLKIREDPNLKITVYVIFLNTLMHFSKRISKKLIADYKFSKCQTAMVSLYVSKINIIIARSKGGNISHLTLFMSEHGDLLFFIS